MGWLRIPKSLGDGSVLVFTFDLMHSVKMAPRTDAKITERPSLMATFFLKNVLCHSCLDPSTVDQAFLSSGREGGRGVTLTSLVSPTVPLDSP